MLPSAALAAAGGILFSIPFLPLLPEAAGTALAFLGFFLFCLSVSRASSPKVGAMSGLLFGLFSFTPGLSWVYQSLHVYGGLPAILGIAALLLLAFANSLFCSAAAALSTLERTEAVRTALVFPALFTLFDWLRGSALCSFPWVSIGYLQSGTPFGGIVPILGTYGAGLAASVAAGSAAAAVLHGLAPKARGAAAASAAFVTLLCALAGFAGWTEPGRTVPVRLVQPGLPLAGLTGIEPLTEEERIRRTAAVTGKIQDQRLVIWPESVVNTSIQRLTPPAVRALADAFPGPGSSLVLNSFWEPHPLEFRNSLFLIRPGMESERYDKRHLVPFGEYVPPGFHWFVAALGIPMSDQTPGKYLQKPFTIPVYGLTAAPMICYENAFGDELRAFWSTAPAGQPPSLLVVSSNLAWFSESVQHQHLLFSRLRAKETALPLVSVNNNGSSAVITPDGAVESRLGTVPGVLDAEVVTRTGGPTPFVRFGNLPAAVLALLLALLPARAVRRKKQKTDKHLK
ncbi:MAG: apolipoprotein N-acyltransferase [Sutterellaceae bacterium]|nr:apolipoprotein N-acyltransferase [Sutterellaceae bacterium]MDD7442017.1 apolipoprotein N-acyltransferase [Sutterellaceae bacterium]MDY2869179.1 apolipoprotein N-acyltransferase [Mesosutterella sp.]